ncbi:hypothetical protein KTT_29240 [Tengunoibacter tsumagoiensis]|uniref:Photosynthesis system II assembly factor Ycf48/Hcf136-like domain-containing protein n=1 Tax=Tengunoibacter tsumagoiensis TaxID=2014871 RepID=A0A402A1Y4_9CHLR|nr:hypothetical protein KTT_29240 [Tengunoibacter tsumagoiensis]
MSACGQEPIGTGDGGPLPAKIAEPLTQVRLVDANSGWALTKHAILHTLNGGQQWSDVTPPSAMASGGDKAESTFQTAQRAWVVVPASISGSSGGLHIVVWHTTDAGKNWTSVTINDSDAVGLADRPNFVDDKHGWLLVNLSAGAGSQGVHLYHTNDAGQTWKIIAQAPGSLSLSGQKAGPTFENTQQGWISHSVGALTDSVLVERSNDGGVTWADNNLPPLAGVTDAFYETTPPVFIGWTGLMPVHVSSSAGQWLAMYSSGNDGGRWYASYTKDFDTHDIYIADETHYWALDKGALYANTTGASNWSKIATLASTADKMSFINANQGWITDTANAVLYHTTDGGHTWTTIHYTIV